MMKYKAVLFDMDGTLLDTLTDLADAVNHILSVHGYPLRTVEEVRIFVGNGARRLMERAMPPDVTGDAFEALLAAIYLDGGIERARAFLLPMLETAIAESASRGSEDYKSKLQKIVQQTPEELLEYEQIGEEGPPHDRIFTFTVKLNSNVLGTGSGRSKREAEQAAAREALKYFTDEE